MENSLEDELSRLRKHFHVASDAELARALRIGQSTISTWKARGKIPERTLRILEGEAEAALATSPMTWGPQENAALGLALVRFCRAHQEELVKGNFRSALAIANRPGDLWTLFRKAQWDLMAEMDRLGEGQAHPALAMIIHDETNSPEETAQRARDAIQEGRPSVEYSDGTVVKL